MTFQNTISGSEEPGVEFLTVPAPAADLREVARKLLAAAGDRPEQVRSLTGGFRVPFALAKEAGVLDRIAGEEPTTGAADGATAPTGKPGATSDGKAEGDKPAGDAAEETPAPKGRKAAAAQS